MTEAANIATFGAGCFWGVESAFRRLPGVSRTSVGFMGGRSDNPTYDAVCIGNTGHAEVVQVQFDETVILFGRLLELFWTIHDPTTWMRNDPDTGSQYRSVIFFHTPQQHEIAQQSKALAQPNHRNAIATTIKPAGQYFLAERYHQQFEEKRFPHHIG